MRSKDFNLEWKQWKLKERGVGAHFRDRNGQDREIRGCEMEALVEADAVVLHSNKVDSGGIINGHR